MLLIKEAISIEKLNENERKISDAMG